MARENFRGLAKIHDHTTKPKGGPTSTGGPQYGPKWGVYLTQVAPICSMAGRGRLSAKSGLI